MDAERVRKAIEETIAALEKFRELEETADLTAADRRFIEFFGGILRRDLAMLSLFAPGEVLGKVTKALHEVSQPHPEQGMVIEAFILTLGNGILASREVHPEALSVLQEFFAEKAAIQSARKAIDKRWAGLRKVRQWAFEQRAANPGGSRSAFIDARLDEILTRARDAGTPLTGSRERAKASITDWFRKEGIR